MHLLRVLNGFFCMAYSSIKKTQGSSGCVGMILHVLREVEGKTIHYLVKGKPFHTGHCDTVVLTKIYSTLI